MQNFDDEVEYYKRRASAARGLANVASDSTIREIHLAMARRYMALADEAQALR